MPTRNASARWTGTLKGGKGSFLSASAGRHTGTMRKAAIAGTFNFGTRFEDTIGTNPEELIAAAEAACYSMALCAALERQGKPAASVETDAACTLEEVPDLGYTVTRMKLTVRARVPGLDSETFAKAAESTKARCPISRALSGVAIELDATLK